MGVLLITPEKCTGCKSCEMACSLAHEDEINPARARVQVMTWDNESRTVPVLCLQCEDAACMQACPAKAITQDAATGARIVNHTLCIRCRMCMQVCPFGCTSFDVAGRKMLKCDLCNGDPACAKVCPSGAILDVDRSAVNVARRLQAAAKLKTIVGRGVLQ